MTDRVRWIALSSSAVCTDPVDHMGRWGWIDQKQSSSLTLNFTSYINQLVPALKTNPQFCFNPFRSGPVWDDKSKHSQTLEEVLIHIRPSQFTARDRFLLSLSPRKSNVPLKFGQGNRATYEKRTLVARRHFILLCNQPAQSWASRFLAPYLSLPHLQNGNNSPYLLHWW